MTHRFAALLPLMFPVALLAACSSASHGPRASSESALTSPGLGTAKTFAILGGETVTNTGPTTVSGDMGVSPGTAITGFPPGIQTSGTTHSADAVALNAKHDVMVAYDALGAEPCTRDLTGVDLGGLVLGEGVYCFDSSAQLTGTLTLDAKGKADAVFVFKTVTTLTTASNATVLMINGGAPCHVFWKVASSATIGTNTTFVGSILALTSIALQTGASLDGRALARNGAVTMDGNHIAMSTCTAAPVDAGPPPVDTGVAPVDTGVVDAGPAEDTAREEDDTAIPPCDEPEGDCY